nr:MAG TPA: hypothetical protein [Caudoviricetes sp.]
MFYNIRIIFILYTESRLRSTLCDFLRSYSDFIRI